MSDANLHSILEGIWELRFNQKQEECLREFSRLKTRLPILAGRDPGAIDQALQTEDAEAYVSVYCLQASLDRWNEKPEKAESLLRNLVESLQRLQRLVPAVLLLQLGLNQLAQGDWHSAMESFLDASTRSKNDFESLCAEINLAQCLVALGLPRKGCFGRLERLFEKMAAHRDLSGFYSSYEYLRLDEHFRRGDIAKLRGKPMASVENQADIFRVWVGQLPYHRFSEPPATLEVIPFRASLFQKQFRLRTLYGLSHPEDKNRIKPSEWADRVYLWVWRWLTRCPGSSLEQVTSALTQWNLCDIQERLTHEDRCLLRNAVAWLSLFDTATSDLVNQVTTRWLKASTASELLDFEYDIIRYWIARRDRDERASNYYRELAKANPLYSAPDIHLSLLVTDESSRLSENGSPLNAFRARLEEQTSRECDDKKAVIVDLSSLEITNSRLGRKQVSEPLCLALELLHRKSRLKVDDLAFVAFGISRFDPLIHNSRVYNLLARIKKTCAPFVHIQVKSGIVLADAEWNRIAFRRDAEENLAVARNLEWKSFLTSATGAKTARPSGTTIPLIPRRLMHRRQLEALTGKSRATVSRLVLEWEKKGWIKRQGKARSTQYALTPTFIAKWQAGEVSQ